MRGESRILSNSSRSVGYRLVYMTYNLLKLAHILDVNAYF